MPVQRSLAAALHQDEATPRLHLTLHPSCRCCCYEQPGAMTTSRAAELAYSKGVLGPSSPEHMLWARLGV